MHNHPQLRSNSLEFESICVSCLFVSVFSWVFAFSVAFILLSLMLWLPVYVFLPGCLWWTTVGSSVYFFSQCSRRHVQSLILNSCVIYSREQTAGSSTSRFFQEQLLLCHIQEKQYYTCQSMYAHCSDHRFPSIPSIPLQIISPISPSSPSPPVSLSSALPLCVYEMVAGSTIIIFDRWYLRKAIVYLLCVES